MCLSLPLGWRHLTERPYQGRISLATQCKAGPRWQCWRRREHILGRFPCQPPEVRPICPTALLPMFQDSADTVAMICHSIDVVKNAAVHTVRELEFRSVPFTCCEQTSTAFLIKGFLYSMVYWSGQQNSSMVEFVTYTYDGRARRGCARSCLHVGRL